MPAGRVQQERVGLPAAEAAVRADQLLEGHDLAQARVVRARRTTGRRRGRAGRGRAGRRRPGAVRRQRVVARRPATVERGGAGPQVDAPAGPVEDDGAVRAPGQDRRRRAAARPDRDQPRVQLLEPPPGSAAVGAGAVDVRQAARHRDHHVGRVASAGAPAAYRRRGRDRVTCGPRGSPPDPTPAAPASSTLAGTQVSSAARRRGRRPRRPCQVVDHLLRVGRVSWRNVAPWAWPWSERTTIS